MMNRTVSVCILTMFAVLAFSLGIDRFRDWGSTQAAEAHQTTMLVSDAVMIVADAGADVAAVVANPEAQLPVVHPAPIKAAPLADTPADDAGLFTLIMTGKYLAAVGVFLVLFVSALRSVLSTRVPWFATKPGGYLLGFGSATLLYLGAAWQQGAGVTLALFATALAAGWTAAGSWEHFLDLITWLKTKPPMAQATAAGMAAILICGVALSAASTGCRLEQVAQHAIVDCTKANEGELKATADALWDALAHGASWSVVEDKAIGAGVTIGGCALALTVQRYGDQGAQSFTGQSVATGAREDAHRALEDFRAKHAGGATFRTAGGDL